MEKYELDAVLEKNIVAVLKNALVPVTKKSSVITRLSSSFKKSRKQVQFNENVDVQWPEAAERLRTEAATFIARRKAEREARLVALVYREEGRNKGKSQEDPLHPHFPFPMEFKPIDFDHLDPYKLYEAAEYLRQEERRLAEPFIAHANKMKSLGKMAEAALIKEEQRLLSQPTQSPRKTKRHRVTVNTVPTHSRLTVVTNLSGPKLSTISGVTNQTVVTNRMKNTTKRLKTISRHPASSQVRNAPTQNLAMRNVTFWLKSNYTKSVPLILHSPKVFPIIPPPASSKSSNFQPRSSSYSFNLPESFKESKEIHILNGIVMPPNTFNDTVGNSFADDYDTTVFKDNLEYKQNWTPHRFRCTVKIGSFQDHEISFFFKRPFLTVKANTPRTLKKIGQKAEETIEVPDWLQIENLKIYRLPDGKIIIEETRRKSPPFPKKVPEPLETLKRYPAEL